MRILFLPKYSESGPSSRYRIYQYLKYFKEISVNYKVVPLFSDKFVRTYLSFGKKRYIFILIGFIKRFFVLTTFWRYNVILVEYELFPYLPALCERLMNFFGKKLLLILMMLFSLIINIILII